MPNFSDYLNILKHNFSYVEDETFKWDSVIALLIIKLKNTDSLNKEREESNATQIQLTSKKEADDGGRPTEDFFPTLTLNNSFKSWRITIPARIHSRNVLYLGGEQDDSNFEWLNDTIQLRRRLLNADDAGNGNPTLQMCYGDDLMPLRSLLQVDDYLVIVKTKNSTVYEAFGVKKDLDLGSGKQMLIAENSSQDSTSFGLSELVGNQPISKDAFISGLKKKMPRNRIVFGAPGTGKSFRINADKDKLIGKDNEDDYERVTFHPDYTYGSFVGTYKPVSISKVNPSDDKNFDFIIEKLNDKELDSQKKYDILFERLKSEPIVSKLPVLVSFYSDGNFKPRTKKNNESTENYGNEIGYGQFLKKFATPIDSKHPANEEIVYEFVPGPFMRLYVKAIKNVRTGNPKPFVLLIEEINRANVAAVFGDIFQLLDRGEDNISEYPIQASEDVKRYLAKELGGDPENYSQIRIPDNMFIWATMNSADQGVYPMDTAFKRRWSFEYIGVDEEEKNEDGSLNIPGEFLLKLGTSKTYRIEWNAFRKAINDLLSSDNVKVHEDKLLGTFFVNTKHYLKDGSNVELADDFVKVFENKVLMYLFEDAIKTKRSSVFVGDAITNRFSKLCSEFESKGLDIFAKVGNEKFTAVYDKYVMNSACRYDLQNKADVNQSEGFEEDTNG